MSFNNRRIWLVEGLNGSGKTTFIKKSHSFVNKICVETPYLNPLRWDSIYEGGLFQKYFSDLDIDDDIGNISELGIKKVATNIFLCGAYYQLFHRFSSNIYKNNNILFDRSWISGFVYGTMSRSSFQFLAELYKNISGIVYIDTDVDTCIDRMCKRKDEKEYVNTDTVGNQIARKFDEVIRELVSDYKYTCITIRDCEENVIKHDIKGNSENDCDAYCGKKPKQLKKVINMENYIENFFKDQAVNIKNTEEV